MQGNRPRARKKFVSSGSAPARTTRAGNGGMLKIIIALIVALAGGGGSLGGLLGGGGSGIGSLLGGDYSNMFSSYSNTSTGWSAESNVGKLNTSVSTMARDKLTTLRGDGSDQITIMVYMCGTDLESRSAMATKDLQEMLAATLSDRVTLLLYTGGCSQWRNTSISNKVHQIWQVKNGKLVCLNKNAGSGTMTDANVLSGFIRWANKNYPANRRELIFWDHGGGSISGYGYDENYPRSGSMALDAIDSALKSAGVTFDFVGFDACLMATAETALMLGDDADYLIGSEETEPGIGWYYTNWLTQLSANPSMDTLRVGKQIADDFTKACGQSCPGQATTLSVVDLAELSQTLPAPLAAFSEEAGDLIQNGEYKQVATARSGSREFAKSSGIDQVDLVHFSNLLNTESGKHLAATLLESIKYNQTSANMTDAYGLSIYFPYKKISGVDSISKTYSQIGMDAGYTSCIRKFAQMQVSGQAVAGGSSTASPLSSLLGMASSGGYGSSYGGGLSASAAGSLVQSLLSGRSIDRAGIEDLDRSNTGFLSDGTQLQASAIADQVTQDRLTEQDLSWEVNAAGQSVIALPEEKWEQVTAIDMGMFLPTASGYLDLGLDNVYTFDDDGNMIPEGDQTWIALAGQPVTYHHDSTVEYDQDRYQITGHVPVQINGQRANLILVFDQTNEQGRIAGVSYAADQATDETTAKTDAQLSRGDRIQFLYDVYSSDGDIHKEQALGQVLTITDPEAVEIRNVDAVSGLVRGGVIKNAGSELPTVTYRFTDIYGQRYWTRPLP